MMDTSVSLWQVPSWVVGLALMTTATLRVLWGLDLIAAAILARTKHRLLTSGTLWLGIYFVNSGITPTALLGGILLHNPSATIHVAYALPVVASGVEAGIAWYFLTRERRLSP